MMLEVEEKALEGEETMLEVEEKTLLVLARTLPVQPMIREALDEMREVEHATR